ncbi:hypothetical protein BN2476_940047 [Paraburkholderia piptadeniae]|uniref:Uncharacterized protein n=1 Tax=Paraburkholderia piptadeniae TaxID=1701573 RepID=A0A1N7STY7_9BURK|nr:hypothetical protein BN2476_940047 [Paraburkholderia piptadeniae]
MRQHSQPTRSGALLACWIVTATPSTCTVKSCARLPAPLWRSSTACRPPHLPQCSSSIVATFNKARGTDRHITPARGQRGLSRFPQRQALTTTECEQCARQAPEEAEALCTSARPLADVYGLVIYEHESFIEGVTTYPCTDRRRSLALYRRQLPLLRLP